MTPSSSAPSPSAPAASAPAAGGSGSLRSDVITTRHLVAFVISTAAPLTIVIALAPLAFLLGGEIAPVGYLAAGAVYLLFTVGYAAMSRYITNAGALYAYIRSGLGQTLGGGAAYLAWAGYAVCGVGFCAAAGIYLSDTLDSFFGIRPGWAVCAVGFAIVVTAVSSTKVDIGARVLAVLMTFEVLALVVLAVCIVAQGGAEGLSLGFLDGANWQAASLGGLFAIAFFSFIGFEQTAVYSEETRVAKKAVPRASYIAVAILAVMYLFVTWAIVQGIGPANLFNALSGDTSTIVFDTSATFAGSLLTDVLHVLIITSFFAGNLAIHNTCSRYLFSMGRDQLIPARFSRTHPGTGTPVFAALFQGVVITVTLIAFSIPDLDPYSQVMVWMSIPLVPALLVLKSTTSIAVIRFFRLHPKPEVTLWQRLIAPALAVVALLSVLYLVIANLSLFTGLSPTGVLILHSPLIVAAAAGLVRGHRLGGRGAPAAAVAPVPQSTVAE